MKVLSGEARGRVLRTPSHNNLVRPILARIRKSLFDIIRPRIKNARFLDLYSGTGAVGIEALSEGAQHVTFVEQDEVCLRYLNDNLLNLNFKPRSTVIRGSALGDLSFLSSPYDLVFMGPPYKDKSKTMLALTIPTLLNIEKCRLITPESWVICQHHKREAVSPPTAQWTLFRREKYGDSHLSFLQWIQ